MSSNFSFLSDDAFFAAPIDEGASAGSPRAAADSQAAGLELAPVGVSSNLEDSYVAVQPEHIELVEKSVRAPAAAASSPYSQPDDAAPAIEPAHGSPMIRPQPSSPLNEGAASSPPAASAFAPLGPASIFHAPPTVVSAPSPLPPASPEGYASQPQQHEGQAYSHPALPHLNYPSNAPNHYQHQAYEPHDSRHQHPGHSQAYSHPPPPVQQQQPAPQQQQQQPATVYRQYLSAAEHQQASSPVVHHQPPSPQFPPQQQYQQQAQQPAFDLNRRPSGSGSHPEGGMPSAYAPQRAPQQQPHQHQQAQPDIPVGLPVQAGMGEILCPFCSVRLRFPIGSELLRCGSCQSISRVPPGAGRMNYQQLPPMQVQQPVPPPVQQPLPAQRQVQQAPQPQTTRVQFRCSGCTIWLAADLSVSNGITRCPQCQTLMKPTLNMQSMVAQQQQQAAVSVAPPQPQQQQVAAPSQPQLSSAGLTPALQEMQTQLQLYHTANGLPFPAGYPTTIAARPAWISATHAKMIQQQQNLMQAAQKQAPRRPSLQQQQQQQQVQQPLPQPYQQPGVYPALQQQNVPIAYSGYQVQPPVHRHSVGDYSSMSSQNLPAAQQQLAQARPAAAATIAAPPAISRPRVEHKDEADHAPSDLVFQESMARRLEALHVDEDVAEAQAAPLNGAYRPPKPKAAAEFVKPLLANEM